MKRALLLLMLLVAGACDGERGRGMEIRTYELTRLNMDEALSLLTPYIREEGRLSGKDRLLTIREKPDRLKVIEDLLKKYDGGGESVDVVLNIQVIEADGFTAQDTAIADVEQTLRQMFKYRGYKLLGETRLQAREDAVFGQSTPMFQIQGRVQRLREQNGEKRLPIELRLEIPNAASIASTVTATIGKPVVLGQSTKTGAVILVIRPTIAGS
jgi:type II secretory pathway component GspD/PulD (secretin)